MKVGIAMDFFPPRAFRLVGFLPLIVLLGGCKKKLDQKPLVNIEYSNFWKTGSDAQYGNAAIYSGLQKTFSTAFIEWGDARSDNFGSGGTGENQVAISYNGLTAVTATADWTTLYSTIARANLAIKYVPQIVDASLTNGQRNHYIAQALAIRSFLYFWAVRLWGDVPVRLVPYEDLDSPASLSRSNKDSILTNIIVPDLKKALLLIDKKSNNTFEINYGAILAILTEVYMWQKDYANVLATTDQMIALKKYDLVAASDLKDVYISATSMENIWTLNWNYLTDGQNNIGTKIGSNSNTSNFSIDVPFDIWESKAYRDYDIRRNLNYDSSSAGLGNKISLIWKYYPIDNTTGLPIAPSRSQNEAKLPFYRWPDMLLLRAEALNWGKNDKNGALALVNNVRRRAGVDTLNYNSNRYKNQSNLEWDILTERQLELFAEGKRWFDLVRTNRVLAVMDPIIAQRQQKANVSVTGFSDPRKILWPIARTVLIADQTLTQNPPYTR